ncbi:hypothetical protein EDD22DRAFT_748386, partial [Suillus occidentalis]
GLQYILGWKSLSYKDPGGSPTLQDMLVSLRTGHTAKIMLLDVQTKLNYFPSTMLFISGLVLEYVVGPWDGGEHFIIA